MMRKGPSAASLKSVTNTRLLLVEICENPDKFVGDAPLMDALSSQGKLAGLIVHDREILGVSLNALKRAAKIELQRGFVELDELRVAANAAITKFNARAKKIKKRSVAGLSQTVAELQDDLASAKEDCDLLTDTFYASVNAANTALKFANLEEARESWQKAVRELFAQLSLARRYDKESSKKGTGEK